MDPDSAAIDIPLQECSSPSASSKFLSGKRANASRASSSPAPPSTLLQAIRSAFRGADPESPKSLSHDGLADIQERSTHFVSNGAEESLAWSDTAVCWSRGGVIQRYWDFKDQDETVRWACKGKLEQTSSEAPLNNHASRPEPSATPKSHSITSSTDITSPESNFGPFWKWRAENRKRPGLPLAVDAVYIFLRTSLRIFLMDGTDFTVSLPFTVRKAWAIWPHGVMIQRTVDRKEVEEAEALDEYLLPSLFTLTSPFVELASVGITNGIVGTPGSTKMVLVDEEDLSNRALESVEATEMVVHVGDHWAKTPETVVVTVDSASSKLSIWRYAAIPPVDLPPPLMSDRNSSDGRPHAFDEHPSLLQTGTTNEQMTSKGQMSSSSTTSSLATMLANIKTDFLADGEAYGGLNTSMRQDTSTALPQTDTAGHVPVARIPEAHGRMEAACWMQRLHVETIAASE
jgi:anaphase-promoting complex subunit 1